MTQDNHADPQQTTPTPPKAASVVRGIRFAFKFVLPLVILAGGAMAATMLLETSPKAKRQPPVKQARLVETQSVRYGTEVTVIEAMGAVKAARSLTLQPRVSGSVNWISDEFIPGGLFKAGEKILTLESTDYALVVKQREADVAEAKSAAAIERGQQAIAQREFELLGKRKMSAEEKDLVLRKPQLAEVQAAVQTAQATLTQAQLDLKRTTVTVPFDAVVQSRDVDLGAQVTSSTTLATLAGTSTYWIEAAVPVDQLKWIDIPRTAGDPGSVVRVYNDSAWGKGVSRKGRVIRLSSDLEENGRMAKLLIAVDDPLSVKPESAGKPILLIGTYVRVEIEGVRIGPAAIIDRNLIRDDDTVWLLSNTGTLTIRPVDILYRGKSHVIADGGLSPDAQIITTDLTNVVEGMPVRTREVALNATRSGAQGNRPGGAQGRPTQGGRPE